MSGVSTKTAIITKITTTNKILNNAINDNLKPKEDITIKNNGLNDNVNMYESITLDNTG